MGGWFLSYNSHDLGVIEPLTARLGEVPDLELFFAPKSLQAGGYWLPTMAEAIADASAFVLIIGQHGLGPWQILEYYEALDRHVKVPSFPLVVLLLGAQPAPGLPFLRQLHWVVADDPASEQTMGRLVDAVAGVAGHPSEPWRYTAPYRGLAAMTEADGDFFFGRTSQTCGVLQALAAEPGRIPLLIGNSGVGKSSLAQAGVLAALKRQAWPEERGDTERAPKRWPAPFERSRGWVYLKLQPGAEPIRAIVEQFVRTWQFEPTDPLRASRQNDWIEVLNKGRSDLRDLLDATERRFEELGQPGPPAFFLYIDQGEELYVRAEEVQRRRFSELLFSGLPDPRLYALMSLRADFLGALQNDAPLFEIHRQISVPPLRETGLQEVVGRPAASLGARFESPGLAQDLAQRAAEESVRDAGALPLLSYLLDDMWTQMVQRGDGVLRLPAQAVELGGVLAQRANAFLARYPNQEEQVRRVLTLKLASVREDSEPTRRRATRSEFTSDEWRLICELADHPHRLLVTATPEGLEPYAEVAHEALFRRWDALRGWIAAEKEFLAWKTSLEADRRSWEAAPEETRNSALLMGLSLAQARTWLVQRSEDLPTADRQFIEESLKREADEQHQRERMKKWVARVTVVAFVVVSGFAAFAGWQWFDATRQRNLASQQTSLAEKQKEKAERLFEAARGTVDSLIVQISQALETMAGLQERSVVQHILETIETTIGALVRQAPEDLGLRRSRSAMLMNFGDIYVSSGQTQAGLAAYAQGLDIRRQVAAVDPANTDVQRDIAVSLERIGDVRRSAADPIAALAAYNESLDIRHRIAEVEPACRQCQRDLSIVVAKVGDMKRTLGEQAEALAHHQKSLAIGRNLALADPANPEFIAQVVGGLVRVQSLTADASQRRSLLNEARRMLVDLEAREASTPELKEWRQLIESEAAELR